MFFLQLIESLYGLVRYSLRSLASNHNHLSRMHTRTSKHSIRSDLPRSRTPLNSTTNLRQRPGSPHPETATPADVVGHYPAVDKSWQRHEARRSFAEPRAHLTLESTMKPAASTSRSLFKDI